jgi:thymidylate synthase (FAD)
MKIVKSSYKIEDKINGNEILEKIERAGRTCYKSEKEITAYSAKKFVKMLFETGHESVLEHEKITVRVTCDRGLSHEIVRHRIASYSQESTRYCNYSKSKFGNEIVLIQPAFWNSKSTEDKEKLDLWKKSMDLAEKVYMRLIALGATPQEARSVLPNSLKTEIVMTMNLREWRHFFKLRTSYSAHPQMRELFRPMLNEFKKQIPVVFDDITY